MPDDPFGDAFGPLGPLVGQILGNLGNLGDLGSLGDLRPPGARGTHGLNRFGRDLTADARAGLLDPVIGRDDEIDQVLEVLARRTKNNPVLLGDPGVGKTAIVEGIAQRIADGEVPAVLREVRLVALDLAGMVAGTKYRGEFEERLTSLIREITAAGPSLIVFVDELHQVVGAGAAEGAPMDAGTMLKPALARGELRLIGATTMEEYRRHIEKDAALERRFEPVTVPEPTVAQTVEILRGLRARYEGHHGVTISDAALQAAAELSDRYVRDRFLPDKAIDLIDRAAARAGMGSPNSAQSRQVEELTRARDVAVDAEDYERAMVLTRELERLSEAPSLDKKPQITADDIAQIVARRTGIPVAELGAVERDRLLRLEELLHKRIVGQDDAVEAVADAVRSGRAGLGHPGRPVGSFLFLGPTGVGKTELGRALAEALFGSPDKLVRLDLSEYADRSAVTRMIGAPPGHVGYEDAGQLTEAVRRDPYTVLLLDELEKAHPDVAALLLQVLDAGRLTDAHGRVVDFRHAIVIMTSNVGADRILAAEELDDVRDAVLADARSRLRPELIGRVDEVVLFARLTRKELREIVILLLDETRERLGARGVELVIDDAAVDLLAGRGQRPELGARPLRRTISREVERRLARMLLAGDVVAGQRVRITDDGGELTLQVG
jgi:ATP-dependent Clp protease ATP-binding subunit ClpC